MENIKLKTTTPYAKTGSYLEVIKVRSGDQPRNFDLQNHNYYGGSQIKLWSSIHIQISKGASWKKPELIAGMSKALENVNSIKFISLQSIRSMKR